MKITLFALLVSVRGLAEVKDCFAVPNLPHMQKYVPQRKKQASQQATDLVFTGADERTRTADLRITSALLYQLSHIGI